MILPKLNFYLNQVARLSPPGTYLVGGTIRDWILNRTIYDLDFIVPTKPLSIARKVATRLRGTLVVLDDINKIYRVVCSFKPNPLWLDFTLLRGNDIIADLGKRDFTINSIALPLTRPFAWYKTNLIDPYKGISDLKQKNIQITSVDSFRDDPLRLLRAYRFTATLGFSIDPVTFRAILRDKKLINRIAGERVRDELFKIFTVPFATPVIHQLDASGLLPEIFPEIKKMKRSARKFYFHPQGLWQHACETMEWVEKISARIPKYFKFLTDKIELHLHEPLSTGITRLSLLKFVALFHDVGKPSQAQRVAERMRFFGHETEGGKLIRSIMQRLKMSNREIHIATRLVSHHMRIGSLTVAPKITIRAVFRLFRDLGDEVLDLLVLSLADRYSYLRISKKPQEIYQHRDKINKVLACYVKEKKRVVPPKLVTGYDVMQICKIPSGPEVGKILTQITELQASGKIATRHDALKYLKGLCQV